MTEEFITTPQLTEEEAIIEAQREADNALIQQHLDEMYREELRQRIEPYILRASDKLPPLKPVVKRHDTLICSEGKLLTSKIEQKLGITLNYARVKVRRALDRGLMRMDDNDVVSLPA